MPNNTGLLLLGLGALFFLGRGGSGQTVDADSRLLDGGRRALPMPPGTPAFDLQSYIDGLFRDTATVPVQPPMQYFVPPRVVVTSSGVPGISPSAPLLITPTTKVRIGGDGGETITASALAVLRSEQIAQQQFEAAANVQPRTWAATVEANRIEEDRQKQFARDLIAKQRAAQAERNATVVKRTRADQEQLNRSKAESRPPTINFAVDDDVWSMNPFAISGQPIVIDQAVLYDDAYDDAVDAMGDFGAPEYSESFEISGGMDSPPGFASEDEQPSGGATVHEITAAYDIGF